MKNTILSVLALVLALAALGLSLVGFVKPEAETVDYSAEIAALQEHNALLQSQIDALTGQMASGSVGTGLSGWDLSVTPWENGGGASVTLTAVPAGYEEGMTASLSVRLSGKEVRNVACSWTGDSFTATAELDAQDGYGYYCVLTDAEGSRQQFSLTTPENPVLDIPVYLASSMEAYCNLMVDSWFDRDNVLTLATAYAQAQLPLLSSQGAAPEIENAQLLLYCNNALCGTAQITLEPADASGAYELTIMGAELAMPELQEDDCLDLYLEVTLSDGTVLTALGASWYADEDGLFAVMG